MSGLDQDPEDRPSRPRQPLFLARQKYRRRRMMDASRLLPVIGFFLFLLPILWRPAETAEADTARGEVYVFSIWFGLIFVAFLLARWLAPLSVEGGEETEDR
ncbi:hypothetical protein [Ostreiculturibacter nitratireducens]|uniref:hypothetical protein n=1 Tax=Ostreiculturibacter nitratireducens TaxID=3075226 RepID=UPI0031B5FB9E